MALDSTLKTQLAMGESQRTAALDVSNMIISGFQAASEGLRFKAGIEQNMLASAAQFKQIEMEEWWKTEQLKIQQSELALREKQMQDMAEHRKKTLELQAKRIAGVEKLKEESKEYDQVGGLIAAEKYNVLAESENLEREEVNIRNQIAAFEDKIRATKADPSLPIAAKEERIAGFNNSISELEGTRSTLSSKMQDVTRSLARYSSLETLAKSKALPLDEIRKMWVNPTGNPEVSETQSFLANSGVDTIVSATATTPSSRVSFFGQPSQEQPQVSQTQAPQPLATSKFGTRDVDAYLSNDDVYEPYTIKEKAIPNLKPEEIKSYRDRYANVASNVFTDIMMTSPQSRKEILDSYKPELDQIDKWFAVDPEKNFSSRAISREAIKAYDAALQEYRGGNENKAIEEGWYMTKEGQDAIEKQRQGFLQRNFNITPTDAGNKGVGVATAGKAAAQKDLSGIQEEAPLSPDGQPKKESPSNKYIDLFIPTDKRSDLAMAGETSELTELANTYNKFKSYEDIIRKQKDTPEKLAEALWSLSDEDLALGGDIYQFGGFGVSNLIGIGPNSISQQKKDFIKKLIESGKAYEILAEVESRKDVSNPDSIRKAVAFAKKNKIQ